MPKRRQSQIELQLARELLRTTETRTLLYFFRRRAERRVRGAERLGCLTGLIKEELDRRIPMDGLWCDLMADWTPEVPGWKPETFSEL